MKGELIQMAENRAHNRSRSRSGAGISLVPTPWPTIHLKTLDHVRIEMAKVYRDMKRGNIATQDGTRLVYVLSQIGRMVEAREVEEDVLRFSGNYVGLPRDPVEARDRLEQLRSEKLTRIRADPRAFRNELSNILRELEPAQREVLASALRGIDKLQGV